MQWVERWRGRKTGANELDAKWTQSDSGERRTRWLAACSLGMMKDEVMMAERTLFKMFKAKSQEHSTREIGIRGEGERQRNEEQNIKLGLKENLN